MSDFLLELRSEEIPARMQAGARAELARLFAVELEKSGLSVSSVTTYATPRRLALIARDLPASTEPVREETKGPRSSAPPQALEGFLRKTGLTQDQLTERGGVWYAVTETPGRATRDVIAEAIPTICRAFSWPKSMRWGAASLSSTSPRWVRPLSGIVAILGEELVECEVGGVRSSYATLGHRFHHPGEITIGGAHDYADKLRACHVLVDHAEREALIRDKARAVAAEAGLELVQDGGLVVENAGLTEWPVPLLGRFDAEFLEVPPEVIQLTARTNQKYFVCTDGAGRLANAFVCTANIEAADGGAGVVAGNRKVLAARLADARFFREQDRRKTLAEHAEGLARITFHEKLGTVADKAERVAKLARWLVEEGIVAPLPFRGGVGGGGSPDHASLDGETPHPNPSPEGQGPARARLATLAEQAALLCKADLVTEMVGEFPELQGLIGSYYARAEGLPDEVADAIRDHYKPVGQGDEVPTAPVTVAVSLADKLDTLFGFFFISQAPTGSSDPYALRRSALSIISLLVRSNLRMSLHVLSNRWISFAFSGLKTEPDDDELYLPHPLLSLLTSTPWEDAVLLLRAHDIVRVARKVAPQLSTAIVSVQRQATTFLADRLKVQQREAGVRHDLIDAVFALGGEDDLVRLLARVHALQAFVGTADGANLLAGYKRAANILKKEGYQAPLPFRGGDGGGGSPQAPSPDVAVPHPNPSPEGEGLSAPSTAPDALHDADGMAGAPGEIPRTGDEDPYALVDDPDLGPILAAKLRERGDHPELSDAPPQQPPPAEPPEPEPNPPAAEQARKPLSYTPEAAEKALIEALDRAAPKAAAAVEAEDFAAAMAALASLRAPIDRFFDEVTVNDADPAKRSARLALLDRFRAAVHNVADFSRIEG